MVFYNHIFFAKYSSFLMNVIFIDIVSHNSVLSNCSNSFLFSSLLSNILASGVITVISSIFHSFFSMIAWSFRFVCAVGLFILARTVSHSFLKSQVNSSFAVEFISLDSSIFSSAFSVPSFFSGTTFSTSIGLSSFFSSSFWILGSCCLIGAFFVSEFGSQFSSKYLFIAIL
jgi:hypothetical protein